MFYKHFPPDVIEELNKMDLFDGKGEGDGEAFDWDNYVSESDFTPNDS